MVGSCSYQRGPAKTSSKSTAKATAGICWVWRCPEPKQPRDGWPTHVVSWQENPGDASGPFSRGWWLWPSLTQLYCMGDQGPQIWDTGVDRFPVSRWWTFSIPTACSNLEWIGTDCHPDFEILGHIRTSVYAVRQDTEHSHPFPSVVARLLHLKHFIQ